MFWGKKRIVHRNLSLSINKSAWIYMCSGSVVKKENKKLQFAWVFCRCTLAVWFISDVRVHIIASCDNLWAHGPCQTRYKEPSWRGHCSCSHVALRALLFDFQRVGLICWGLSHDHLYMNITPMSFKTNDIGVMFMYKCYRPPKPPTNSHHVVRLKPSWNILSVRILILLIS